MNHATAARPGAAHAPPGPGLVQGSPPRDGSDPDSRPEPTAVERVLGFCTTLRPGEGTGVLLFFVYAYVLLLCYYILKTLREPLLLGTGSAELKSYANAAIALVLLALVPLYSAFFRRFEKRRLVRLITTVSLGTLGLFCLLGRAGVDVGFIYYVWVGVFGVMMLAQFWAHAACTYKVESGERLFPVVMAGAALGGLSGPPLIQALYPVLGPWNLMLVAIVLLGGTLPLVERTWNAVPLASRTGDDRVQPGKGHLLGGFALVLRQRYLLLLAAMVVLLNGVNAIGEYLLTDYVVRNAEALIAEQPGLDRGALIARFYGNYFLAVNALSLLLQVALVARLFRWIGVQGALLVLPAIALVGYGLIVFVPAFTLVRVLKILENSTDYSIMNTVRQALYLPLPTRQKCEGKTTIDTFFWRAGDLLQAGVIYLGLNWFAFEPQHFALVNVLLAGLWLVVAVQIGSIRAPRHAAPPSGSTGARLRRARRQPCSRQSRLRCRWTRPHFRNHRSSVLLSLWRRQRRSLTLSPTGVSGVGPDSSRAHHSLGQAYAEKGEKELAMSSFERSIELNPANGNAVERLQE